MTMRMAAVLAAALLIGCTAEVANETDAAPASSEAAGTRGLPDYIGERPEAHDPCVTGMVLIDGRHILVPVPCRPFFIDKGDPPPDEALRQPNVRPEARRTMMAPMR